MEIEHDSQTSRRYKENWDDAVRLLNEKDARIAELEKALRIYGGHIPECKGRPCECGFQAAWDSLPTRTL
jgi:hypothetical protein